MEPKGQPALQRKQSRTQMQGKHQDMYRPEYIGGNNLSNEKLWELMGTYQKTDVDSIQRSIVRHVEYTLCKNRFTMAKDHCYLAVAHSLRDRLIESFNDTQQHCHHIDAKRVYYMSLEFLLGRQLQNTVTNLKLEQQYADALMEIGFSLEDLYTEEVDPALGNGGLGRLAACFLDSLATLNYPGWGYGIRYNYGIFKQKIQNGYQIEVPDYWLMTMNPWEIQRGDIRYPVRFYGNVRKDGNKSIWENGEIVLAEAYDNPLPGYDTFNSINLRLWKSIPTNEFSFELFNKGDYFHAIQQRQRAEYITSVLYPNDSNYEGKELRLKQQYFFVCATIQDVIRRFKKRQRTWEQLPNMMAIQLNDTHPALSIVELLRVMIDEEGLEHQHAFNIIYKVFAYTNHTVLPEALEKWDVTLLEKLLPRHLQLIYEVNHFFLQIVRDKYPNNYGKLSSLSCVEEGDSKKIRMANLCVIGSHAVNGVAAIHSELIKNTLFKDFYEMNPKKFQNKTNGVTPRRWVKCCNPWLSDIYAQQLGEDIEWPCDFDSIRDIAPKAEDVKFQEQWKEMKVNCKKRLQKWVKDNMGIEIPLDSLYDVQVKRIHEYKRQLMNALFLIHQYLMIKDTPHDQRAAKFTPRVCFIGGKAAPGYLNAKRIIKLVNSIANKVNNDQDIGNLLKVVFLPNYCVSFAEIIIPASELSEHISTAGTEASGTSNMKFVMNGGLIIGTMDGANVEIAEEVGQENMFIFGARVNEIHNLKEKMSKMNSNDYMGGPLRRVFGAIDSGMFEGKDDLVQLINTIRNNNDQYLVCHDFYSYIEAQRKADDCYKNQPQNWWKMSILNATKSCKFNSDRTITEYAQDIWDLQQVPIPQPALRSKERVKSYLKFD